MIAVVLSVATSLAPAPLEWSDRLARLRLDVALGPGLVDGLARFPAEAPRGLARGWVETGLLAALNRAGATPTDAAGRIELGRLAAVWAGAAAGARWALAVDRRGRLSAAWIRVPVPVDPSRDPPGGFSPARLAPLRRALAALERFGLRAVHRGPRGNVLGWDGRHGGGHLAVRYHPAADELGILLHSRAR